MDLIQSIIRCEIDFARDFSNAVDRPWGVLFHNADISDSHDSNHACITNRTACLPDVVHEVTDFYRSRQLTPRLYHLGPDHGDALRAVLATNAWTFYDHRSVFVVHRQASTIQPVDGIAIRRVTQMTPPLCEMIERSSGVRQRKVVERQLRHPSFHLFVGFIHDQPCSMAALQVVGEMTCVGEVLTDLPHRGKGYSRAVIDHLVRYHARCLSNTTLYLYTDNPTAERIYREAGFVDIDAPLCSWSAALEPAAC